MRTNLHLYVTWAASICAQSREKLSKSNRIITHKLARKLQKMIRQFVVVFRSYGDFGAGNWSGSREAELSKASFAWKNLSASHIRFALLQHCPVCSADDAAAVASSIRIIALVSGLAGWVIILKSSWSNVNRGVLHLGILLERGVPANKIHFTIVFRQSIYLHTSRRTHAGWVHTEVRRTDNARHPCHTGVAEEL